MLKRIKVEGFDDDELLDITPVDLEWDYTEEERKNAWNDMLRNANTGMMSWAEKNFKMKLIDNLYHMRYYKTNQTIYLTSTKGEK